MASTSIYDVVGAFQRIEEELIDSMGRNMKRHILEEYVEEINWKQWQADMLNGMAKYRNENADIVAGYYSTINSQIEELIKEAEKTGESETEIETLRAIQEGYKAEKVSSAVYGSFFAVNEIKLNALIESTTNDFKQAEKAILRRTDDVYRSTIFNAQMYYNSGAGSLDKAIDMATKDFLSGGINCIEYANGARVNIASYAEMALRTSNKRANFIGAAGKREEWGIHTVEVTSHGSACPKCIPWQGRIYIDDVYGSGTEEESKETGYPMLSEAVGGGMFHPNCKNGLSTYYDGVTKEPAPATDEQKEEMARRYNLEQEQRYCERNIRKYTRLSNGSIDAENAAKYSDKLKQWNGRYDDLIKSNEDILREDERRLKLYGINE